MTAEYHYRNLLEAKTALQIQHGEVVDLDGLAFALNGLGGDMTHYERLINNIHELNATAEGEPVETIYRKLREMLAQAEAVMLEKDISGC